MTVSNRSAPFMPVRRTHPTPAGRSRSAPARRHRGQWPCGATGRWSVYWAVTTAAEDSLPPLVMSGLPSLPAIAPCIPPPSSW